MFSGFLHMLSSLAHTGRLHPSSDIGSHRLINCKGLDSEEFHACYICDPHSATHRTLTGETNPQAHWRFGWTRSQCFTVAQLRTGHCPLLASYLHRIGRQHSPVCPYCGGDDDTAQHLYFAACDTRRHVHLPATSTQPILDACGPSWSQSGP